MITVDIILNIINHENGSKGILYFQKYNRKHNTGKSK